MNPVKQLLLVFSIAIVVQCLEATSLHAIEIWPTSRGNLERTGNSDGLAGPVAPKVLWVFKSSDNFVAAPVPFGDRVFVSGISSFNVPTLYCLAADPSAAHRLIWSKTAPLLKGLVVSSPAIAYDRLVFGDGTHEAEAGDLFCLRCSDGLPISQFPLAGKLVHLEGAPTVKGSRAYFGGGSAGVICVDLDRVMLDGKEQAIADVVPVLEAKWKEILAKYETSKKQAGQLAVPPGEDSLPRPKPVLIWQQGLEKWHVDSPVAVTDRDVLASSAHLDQEGLADRALFCLDRESGAVRWRAPMNFNPWGGPSVSGNLVVIGGSSIRYDPKQIEGARGELAAFRLADGKEKWRKAAPGALLSCLAISNGLVIAASTNGKVRAFDLGTGEVRWTYDGKASFFAAPAIAGGVVYVGDLKGVIHAIGLEDGRTKWTLDLARETSVNAPGMIYGGPVVQGGHIFIATCNLAGAHAGQSTVVVCIGEK